MFVCCNRGDEQIHVVITLSNPTKRQRVLTSRDEVATIQMPQSRVDRLLQHRPTTAKQEVVQDSTYMERCRFIKGDRMYVGRSQAGSTCERRLEACLCHHSSDAGDQLRYE
jgi:hypothetical protein